MGAVSSSDVSNEDALDQLNVTLPPRLASSASGRWMRRELDSPLSGAHTERATMIPLQIVQEDIKEAPCACN